MNLDELALDFAAIASKQRSVPEQIGNISPAELQGLTGQLCDRLEALTADASDAQVVFVATDPAQSTEPGWNLAHIVLHITSSLEEGMALASTLARGVAVTGRSRYEPDWETVTTAAQVAQRLAESRRMALAFLDTWPDAPHLETIEEHPYFGPLTATARAVVGLNHGRSMLAQVEEIARQARAASA